MRFARFGPTGRERPAVWDGDHWRDLTPVTGDIDAAFLASGPVRIASAALNAETLPVLGDDHGRRLGPPIARPGTIVCVGMNYAAHAAESGSTPPEQPIVFLKAPNTVVGPNDPLVIPRGSEKTDWEVELGVVIGRPVLYLDTPEQAWESVAGYVLANDVSERHLQLEASGGQWSKGKCAPTFTPLGPWLVTPDELSPAGLTARSFVNGEPRQHSTTADMIFSVDTLIFELSQFMSLEPGDLILTGTPEGVALSGRFPYLRAGDIVEVQIDELGHQRQDVIDWRAEC